MLLILDIDETLIFASKDQPDISADFTVGNFKVMKRPQLDAFLGFCFAKFEVGVWTSSTQDYANGVMRNILRPDQNLAFLWARERCTQKFSPEFQEHYFVKDLRKLKRKGYDLDQTLMVDNTPRKLIRNYGNLVRIDDFIGDPADRELLRLQDYLDHLAESANVRAIEKRGWKTRFPI